MQFRTFAGARQPSPREKSPYEVAKTQGLSKARLILPAMRNSAQQKYVLYVAAKKCRQKDLSFYMNSL
jgi:hypothetical protein